MIILKKFMPPNICHWISEDDIQIQGCGSKISTVKPVYNDHLMGYFSAFWSSRRQKLLARVNWCLQPSLKHITEWITADRFYYKGGRYRQASLYDNRIPVASCAIISVSKCPVCHQMHNMLLVQGQQLNSDSQIQLNLNVNDITWMWSL